MEEGRLAQIPIDTGKGVREKEERHARTVVYVAEDTPKDTEDQRDSITEG